MTLREELAPGTSGDAMIAFAPEVAQEAKALLAIGSMFRLAEGDHVIGTAEVYGIVEELK